MNRATPCMEVLELESKRGIKRAVAANLGDRMCLEAFRHKG